MPDLPILNYLIESHLDFLDMCLLCLPEVRIWVTQAGECKTVYLWQRGLLYNSGDVTDLLRGPISGAYHHTYFQFLFGIRLTSVRSYLWIVDREK